MHEFVPISAASVIVCDNKRLEFVHIFVLFNVKLDFGGDETQTAVPWGVVPQGLEALIFI